MNAQHTATSGTMIRRYDYDDHAVIVADLGPGAGDVTVDVVDGTAIIVHGDEQAEVDLPAGAGEAVNRNGIVTFEVTP